MGKNSLEDKSCRDALTAAKRNRLSCQDHEGAMLRMVLDLYEIIRNLDAEELPNKQMLRIKRRCKAAIGRLSTGQ